MLVLNGAADAGIGTLALMLDGAVLIANDGVAVDLTWLTYLAAKELALKRLWLTALRSVFI